jgi:hypothetical protein
MQTFELDTRKRNRQDLAKLLLERKEKSEQEMREDAANPKYQAIVAMLREKNKTNQ